MSSTVPIADPEDLEVCPYDPSHRVQSRRMVYHLERCRKNFIVQKKICPFNGKHRIPAPEMNYHINTCPDKAMIDQDLRYSGMKQGTVDDNFNHGNLNVPHDHFNISSEENWEDEADDNPSYFRLGQKRLESSFAPNDDHSRNEQLRLPTSTPLSNAPIFNQAMKSLGRGRGRGKIPQENGEPRRGMFTSNYPNNISNQSNNVPVGRGFGLGKVGGGGPNQQCQKSDLKSKSVDKIPSENTFTLGIGRGIKKKELIENNPPSNKTAKVLTMDELQKQSRRLEKKLRQIHKLEEMQDDGAMLDKEEVMKLEKKNTLEEELAQLVSKIGSWQMK